MIFYMFVSNSPECFLVAKKASKPFKTLKICTGMYREVLLFLYGVARIRLSTVSTLLDLGIRQWCDTLAVSNS